MESDPFQNFQQQQTQQQPNSGLMRYRSAPSSYFTNLLEKDFFDDLLMNRPASPDMLSRLISSGDFQRDSSSNQLGHRQSDLPAPAKPKVEVFQPNPKQEQEMTNYVSQNYYQPSTANQGMDYRTVNPLVGGGGNSGGLLRQSSSPAGFFNNHVKGFGVMRNLVGSGGEPSFSPSGRFSNQMTYLPRQQSGQMSPIAEIGSKGVGKGSSPEGGGDYDPDFHWDDSLSMSEGFGGLGRGKDVEVEDGEARIPTNPPLLAHHLSLPNPKASEEMNSFLRFQDSVPCKVRAKRGFATHPRSIAERVRRTKISERIRKLQDLVPNMDKQTNTSDMLDLAVDYIKVLQDQVKSLSDNRSKCVCSNKQML